MNKMLFTCWLIFNYDRPKMSEDQKGLKKLNVAELIDLDVDKMKEVVNI